MSLDPNSGSCTEVVLTNTQGNIFADYGGEWSGSNDFVAQSAIYQLAVSNFKRTTSQFAEFMKDVEKQLEIRGNLALTSTPTQNLLVWMMWQIKEPDYLFQMSGSIKMVLNREHQNIGLATNTGVCPIKGTHGFDFGSGSFFVEHDIVAFSAEALCNTTWSATSQGYLPQIDRDKTKNDFDATSMITAIGVGFCYVFKCILITNSPVKLTCVLLYAGE